VGNAVVLICRYLGEMETSVFHCLVLVNMFPGLFKCVESPSVLGDETWSMALSLYVAVRLP
jgi:hypothetical protein